MVNGAVVAPPLVGVDDGSLLDPLLDEGDEDGSRSLVRQNESESPMAILIEVALDKPHHPYVFGGWLVPPVVLGAEEFALISLDPFTSPAQLMLAALVHPLQRKFDDVLELLAVTRPGLRRHSRLGKERLDLAASDPADRRREELPDFPHPTQLRVLNEVHVLLARGVVTPHRWVKIPPVVGDGQVIVAILAAWVFRDEAQLDKLVPHLFIGPKAGVGNNATERLILGAVVGLRRCTLHKKNNSKKRKERKVKR